jgi:hypothetical protein
MPPRCFPKALIVTLDLLRRELEKRNILLDDLLLAEISHSRKDRCHGVLTVPVGSRAAAHAIQIGTDIADEFAVLGYAAEQERVDLVEPRRNYRAVLLRR